MKTKTFLVSTVILFLMTGFISCEQESMFYQGKITSLNSGTGCFNLIEISKSVPQGLPIKTTISFNTDFYNGQLKIGDTVYFKIVKYEKWSGFIFDVCSPPQYVAILEFYNKLNKKL